MKFIIFGAVLVQLEALIASSASGTLGEVSAQDRSIGERVPRVLTKAEIRASMTSTDALEIYMRMNTSRKPPELTTLVQHGMQKHALRLAAVRKVLGRAGDPDQSKKVGSSVATTMLNEMSEETRTSLDVETRACEKAHEKGKREMEEMRSAVTAFNAAAAKARGHVLTAQGQISKFSSAVRDTTEEFEEHKKNCHEEISGLEDQLRVTTADSLVMKSVLGMMDCGDEPAPSLLVQCRHCTRPVLLRHPVQQLISSLKSKLAQQSIQDSLMASYTDSLNGKAPIALTQEGLKSMLRFAGVKQREVVNLRGPEWSPELTDQEMKDEVEVISQVEGAAPLNVSAVPQTVVAGDCVPSTKCTVGSSPSCLKLKDRFLVVSAGIMDKRKEVEGELRERQEFCQTQTTTYTNQINGMDKTLRQERAALAVATEEQSHAESGSHTQSQAHKEASTEFVRMAKECCDNKNQMQSELCALEKIRGELNNMNSPKKVFITDCEVSEWRDADCSKSCGGGILKSARNVITHPVGQGLACPPLEKQETCNDIPCPVDCQLDAWSQWSACSAECGGGVRAMSRAVLVEPLHGGEPCGDTEEEDACGMDACDVDCELTAWGDWSSCSKACGGGNSRRTKDVEVLARGTGKCSEPQSQERLEFKGCNEAPCTELLKQFNGEGGTRQLLKCSSQVDVTLLLDGSSSLTAYGWYLTKQLTSALVSSLNDGTGNVQVSVIVFSGPENLPDYDACTQASEGVDMVRQCKILVVNHFTNDTAALSQKMKRMRWPKGSTLTSVALGVAEAEQKYSRPEAASKVVVFTDGAPMSQQNTRVASTKLQQKADVIWVPIGKSAPFELLAELASKPEGDHVIPVKGGFSTLRSTKSLNDLINQVISTTCPAVS